MALPPLRLNRKSQHRFTGRVNAQFAPVGHAQAEDVHVLARPGAHRLGEERHTDAHQFAAGPLLGLFGTELVIADHVHGQPHGRLVVTRVVQPTGLRLVRKLLGTKQIRQSQLRRVHLQLECQAVDQPFDEVHGLGDAERTRIGHAAGCLVGVDRGHVAVRGFDVVAAGEHPPEEACGGVLDRCGNTIERTVVGEHRGTDRQDLAVAGGRDLPDHDVVPGESGGGQVLAAVLHPFDRPAQKQRTHDRADVSG